MQTEHIEISPAQHSFLSEAIDSFSTETWAIELAGRAGSQRYFLRVSRGDTSFILIVWDSKDEDWQRFLHIGRNRVASNGLLPEIYRDDARHGLILEEDLGSVTLKRYCNATQRGRYDIERIYQATLDALIAWQTSPMGANPVVAARSMDRKLLLWETAYFARFCVTDYCACESLLTPLWEEERLRLARTAASLPRVVMHRDFQSENVMVHKGTIRFVDFQGARLGPAEYDLASLLFDPYCLWVDDAMRSELLQYYRRKVPENETSHAALTVCGAQRLMQALGAYGNLSLHKGKEWYSAFIPFALERLAAILTQSGEFPAMAAVALACLDRVMQKGKTTSA